MSRITTPPIDDGQEVTATDLNARFTAFSQSNAINAFNTRDAAFDLPQFSATRFMAPLMERTIIGRNDYKHGAFNTDTAVGGNPAPFLVRDAAGTYTPLSFGPAGWTLNSDVALRVYWDLSVRPGYAVGSTPWRAAGGYSTWFIGGGATPQVATGVTCWAFWLQWDITSNALVNWADVPDQSDFNNAVPNTASKGNQLAQSMSTTAVPAFNETAGAPTNGNIAGRLESRIGWTGISGDWHHIRPGGSTVIVYGLRVAFTGVLHSYNDGGTNYLIRDDNVNNTGDVTLDHNGGSLEAMLLRIR